MIPPPMMATRGLAGADGTGDCDVMAEVMASSLRRHDPDQVRWV
jgi:hypothetical protein